MKTNQPDFKAYPYLKARQGVWKEIVRVVKKDVPGVETLVELGPGYCDFINQFPASSKTGFELNPEMRDYAAADVDLRIENALLMPGISNGSVDLVFAGNFLEHLDEESASLMLDNICRALKIGGHLILLQPNYRLCPESYFDDETHQTIFSDHNIREILIGKGFEISGGYIIAPMLSHEVGIEELTAHGNTQTIFHKVQFKLGVVGVLLHRIVGEDRPQFHHHRRQRQLHAVEGKAHHRAAHHHAVQLVLLHVKMR